MPYNGPGGLTAGEIVAVSAKNRFGPVPATERGSSTTGTRRLCADSNFLTVSGCLWTEVQL